MQSSGGGFEFGEIVFDREQLGFQAGGHVPLDVGVLEGVNHFDSPGLVDELHGSREECGFLEEHPHPLKPADVVAFPGDEFPGGKVRLIAHADVEPLRERESLRLK